MEKNRNCLCYHCSCFHVLLIGIYYQSRTERKHLGHSAVGGIRWGREKLKYELPCSVTADAEGKVILYNDTLTEDDRGTNCIQGKRNTG